MDSNDPGPSLSTEMFIKTENVEDGEQFRDTLHSSSFGTVSEFKSEKTLIGNQLTEEFIIKTEQDETMGDSALLDYPLMDMEINENPLGTKIIPNKNYRKSDLFQTVTKRPKIDIRYLNSLPERDDIIEDLLKNPFRSRVLEEKIFIIKSGRPTPMLNITTKQVDEHNGYACRNFKKAYYESYCWLTGSPIKNLLYCWFCLLFSEESSNSLWTKEGYNDLTKIADALSTHDKSVVHIRAHLFYNNFKRTNLPRQLETPPTVSSTISEDNKKNILKRMIDCVCFLMKQQISFSISYADDEDEEDSIYLNRFSGLLEMIRKFDPLLDKYLDTSTSFNNNSVKLPVQIASAVADVIQDAIKKEIKDIPFISVILFDAPLIDGPNITSILRYCNDKGELLERFIKLSENVDTAVQDYNLKNKIIGQTYNGIATTDGHLGELKNSVLERAFDSHKSFRIFFANLSMFPSFFNTNNIDKLKQFSNNKSFNVPQWDSNLDCFEIIRNIKSIPPKLLIDFFEEVVNNSYWWKDVSQTDSIINVFYRFDFRFLLETFYTVFSYTDKLFRRLKTNYMNVSSCREDIINCQKNIKKLQTNEFTDMWENLHKNSDSLEIEINQEYNIALYKNMFDEILSTVIQKLDKMHQAFYNLKFVEMLDSHRFLEYTDKFPQECYDQLIQLYGEHFDANKLKNELTILYSDTHQKFSSVSELLSVMYSSETHNILQEVFKLGSLIVTLPIDRTSLPLFEKVNTVVQNFQQFEQLADVAILAIERQLLSELEKDETFYGDVLEKYVQRGNKLELLFN